MIILINPIQNAQLRAVKTRTHGNTRWNQVPERRKHFSHPPSTLYLDQVNGVWHYEMWKLKLSSFIDNTVVNNEPYKHKLC